ncbi:MAG: D-2-hydroxyacid dehydrogenase [Bacteroidales bacterium]|jgi:glycerate dehydrogenase|nr:D-2-hydroxyacid dehydrogenase [Bacteroidales bacterium]
MKIVFLDASTLGADADLSPLKSKGCLTVYDNTPPEFVKERIAGAEVIIVNKVLITKDIIDSSLTLKRICVAATGVNNVDTAYANSRGILVLNVSGYSTKSVTQITFSSLLSLASNIARHDMAVKSGEYTKGGIFTWLGAPFFELSGKSMGIIGMGAIGQEVASVATALGMEVSYFSTSGTSHCNKYSSLTLDQILRKSDVISIHAPLNEKTLGLIGKNELEKMKRTSFLINMGRGGIVNEHDLADAIDKETIAGAAIDVFSVEPLPFDHPFLKIKKSDHLILTPHIAWTSIEARKTLIEGIAANIG